MNKRFLLECATDSVESALAAAAGGADRLELCANLIIGGTTPTLALYDEVRSHSDIPLFILIRPRFGDFLYTDYEANVICREIKMFQKAGAEGVVIGSLNKDGSLNVEHMKRFIDSAKDMSITLHRAFDMCADPFATLKQARELGVNTILTSGQAPSSLEGIDLYEKLIEKANGEISILAGGGIKASTIEKLLKQTSLTAFHMSGKIVVESSMVFRNPAVSMGLPGISEYNIWLTDESNVREARKVLDEAAK